MRVGRPNRKLAALPEDVRRHARVFPNGEVAWSNDHAEAAVEAIAAAGKIVAGLDARTLHDNGTMTEVPITEWHEHAGEAHRAAVERAAARHLMPSPSRAAKELTS
jgi:hypothetical protein